MNIKYEISCLIGLLNYLIIFENREVRVSRNSFISGCIESLVFFVFKFSNLNDVIV